MKKSNENNHFQINARNKTSHNILIEIKIINNNFKII